MSKRVKIEKIGAQTHVTVSYLSNPETKDRYTIPLASTKIVRNEMQVLFQNEVISFELNELEGFSGVGTLQELQMILSQSEYFVPIKKDERIGYAVISVGSDTQSITDIKLVGKQSIDMVVVNGSITQSIPGYNSVEGSFPFQALAGEKLLIFYRN